MSVLMGTVRSAVRYGLGFLCGHLATKGIDVDVKGLEEIVVAAITLGVMVWSFWEKHRAAKGPAE